MDSCSCILLLLSVKMKETSFAAVAQSVARRLGKAEAAGSNPVSSFLRPIKLKWLVAFCKVPCEKQLFLYEWEIEMKEKQVRIIMAVLGVIIGGVSVGFFKAAQFGIDPFQCFMAGMDSQFDIGFGNLYAIVNVVMLVFMFLFSKKYIGVATVINVFLLGYVVEVSEHTIYAVFGEVGVATRVVYLLIGVIVLCFATAVYFSADMGVSTYDAISLILSDRGVAKFKYCRIGTDTICVIIGLVFGVSIGIGTVITAFFMGPLISIFRNKFTDPWVESSKEK